jgi:hypothetical protein
MTTESTSTKTKILVRLEQDEDGYPPFAVEGLWAIRQPSGDLVLDNIPFFARDLAPGDTVAVDIKGSENWLKEVICSGGTSVFRIRASTEVDLGKIREELLDLGLPSEVDLKLLLLAAEVPVGADIRPLLSYLVENQESARFDFEEAALRHALPQ